MPTFAVRSVTDVCRLLTFVDRLLSEELMLVIDPLMVVIAESVEPMRVSRSSPE